jgi:hypothetical protein
MRMHRYAVGQPVSYAEDYVPNDIWRGGYKIVYLVPAGNRELQYQIRGADQTYDRVVEESQLQEDPGVGTMRLNGHVIRFSMSLGNSAKPEFWRLRRTRAHRAWIDHPDQMNPG